MKVLITDYQWPDLEIETGILNAVGAEVVLPTGSSEPELIQAAHGCDAIMTCWAKTTANVIRAAESCRIVSRMGIGLDNIDVGFCTAQGIPVTNVPDYCVIEVAEHALACVLALARKLPWFHHQTKAGIYDLAAAGSFRRLRGQTLGILGLGNIGRQLAKIANGVGLRVIAHSRTPKNLPEIEEVSFETLLAESDYVSLHAPLTDETRHLIGYNELKLMKQTAYLINTSRGGLIDHQALAAALADHQLAGAALDVQEPEPPDLGIPPFNDPKVLVTPHAAFVSEESLRDLRQRAAKQVADRLTGKLPAHVVNGVRL